MTVFLLRRDCAPIALFDDLDVTALPKVGEKLRLDAVFGPHSQAFEYVVVKRTDPDDHNAHHTLYLDPAPETE